MRLYHSTTAEAAERILSEGFRDGFFGYLGQMRIGTWLSDVPLDESDGCRGHVALELQLEINAASIADFEWLLEDATHREWLIPAAVLKRLIVSIHRVSEGVCSESEPLASRLLH